MTAGSGGGACVVVGARESRVQGEGGQGTDRFAATEEPSVDSDDQAEEAWLLGIQSKLYQWSRTNPDGCYRDLWNWVTDLRNLRCAWRRIASNKGSRTAGIDGMTVASIRTSLGSEAFLVGLRDDLRAGRYRASPCRRKWIPKPGKPGRFRPLGIPTVTDRVVQAAVKNLLEPIFEATFWHVSYGFRPGRGCHGALEHIPMTIRPRAKAGDGRRQRAPYQWVIEGDIKGCFDHIDHHLLMKRMRARIGDVKVNRLVGQFLKAGVLEEGFVLPTHQGTPQGGVISPLLANIALSAIEERYERWVHHRRKIRAHRSSDGVTAARQARMSDRRRGGPVFFPIRYADDFVILVSGTREQAEREKAELADDLRRTIGLELSEEKTRISDLTEGFEFLGHRVRLKWHRQFGLMPRIEIPKHKRADLRYRVKQMTKRSTTARSLSHLLQKLNPTLRGWGNFYRYCTGAGQLFASLDHYVGDRIWRWLMKKHGSLKRKRSTIRRLPSVVKPTRKVWREGRTEQFMLSSLKIERFRRGRMRTPAFTMVPGEPDA
ncbi:MAG: group II intron reverse transcriptase/maturase [Nitrospirales bacterium]